MAGIYIHIPFCRQTCHYCSFHFSTSLRHKSILVNAIIAEIEARSHELSGYQIESIYLGGGTPSLLSINELAAILKVIHRLFSMVADVEITLEANPEDINMHQLKSWHDLGINRLSVGIQSFIERDLKYMNRAHNGIQSREALDLIKLSDIKNVTADLMFGLIHSNIEDWEYNLKIITSYDLDHLSIYNLTIEEQTVFGNWKLKNKLEEIPEKTQEHQFTIASEWLGHVGYDHYEISNYAKPGKYAVHNTNYWNRSPYLGIGPSAHSYIEQKRSWNIANNSKYIKMLTEGSFKNESETLTQKELYNEMIMLGLRTKWGIALRDLEQLSKNVNAHFRKESRPLFEKGILVKKNDQVLLSRKSWYLSDHIAAQLFVV